MKYLKRIVIVLVLAGGAAFLYPVAAPGSFLQLMMKLERGRSDLVQKSVEVSPFTIPYLETGAGKPEKILFVHGFAADKDNFTRFIRFFYEDYHVVAPDVPGFGDTERLKGVSYDLPSQADRLIALVDRLGWQKFHIAGNSMGGHLSAIVTHRLGDRVKSLGLFNSGGVTSPTPSEFLRIRHETGRNVLTVSSLEDYDRLLKFIFNKPPFLPGPVKQYFADRAVASRQFNLDVYRQAFVDKPYPLEEILAEIKPPVLVLWGDNDRVIDVSAVEVFKAGLTGAAKVETVIMKDCGHAPMIERPEEAAGHYRAFLKSL